MRRPGLIFPFRFHPFPYDLMKRLVALLVASGLSAVAAYGMSFVHPGALSSKAELDFVKAKISAGIDPWKSEFELVKNSSFAERGPHGLVQVNSTTSDAGIPRDDAAAAYAQALLWYFTDDETYAKRSVAILNAWAGLQGFTAGTEQDRLQAGWNGSVFAEAAEIMRGYPGWTPGQMADFKAMFKRAFYPQLNTASFWNGNVDLTQIDAMMAISVFDDDEAEFQMGLDRLRTRIPAYFYLVSDGPWPKPITGDRGDSQRFWHNPSKWVDGLTQETCRDNGHHAQFGLGSALHSAEVAWHQGVDVYTENQRRLSAAMELMALQFLSGSMQGVGKGDGPTRDRYDAWEVGFNHYHNRAGIALPYTQRLIHEQIRPNAFRVSWNLAYETLTHADLALPHDPDAPSKAVSQ